MPFLLSIRTVFPRKGGRVWYDDRRHVHQQIFAGNDQLNYAFMGTDPEAPEDIWLREAAERQIPLIYFLGVSPERYQAIIPTFVLGWDPRRLTAPVVASYESALCCPTVALSCQSILETDAPCRIRTCDLRIRSPLLYPAELRAHACEIPRSAGARQSSGGNRASSVQEPLTRFSSGLPRSCRRRPEVAAPTVGCCSAPRQVLRMKLSA
jgi:hypothetical protein